MPFFLQPVLCIWLRQMCHPASLEGPTWCILLMFGPEPPAESLSEENKIRFCVLLYFLKLNIIRGPRVSQNINFRNAVYSM